MVIEPVQNLKVEYLGNHNPRLHTDEVLVALSICATTNPKSRGGDAAAQEAPGLWVHSTVILSQVDEGIFRKLGVNLTCEPKYQTKKLFHK